MKIDKHLGAIENVRQFDEQQPGKEILPALLAVAALTPSAANVQPWEVIVVEEKRRQLADCTLDPLMRDEPGLRQSWIVEAPLLLLICIDKKRASARYGPVGADRLAVQDSAVLIHNIRLKAAELGLRSCWLREFDREKIRSSFGLPKEVEPMGVLALGYSDQELEAHPALALREFVHHDHWSRYHGGD